MTTGFVGTVAAVLLLPGLLTACSNQRDERGASTALDAASSGSVTLAECMRGKGHDMEDPSASDKTMKLTVPEGVDKEQWTEDFSACTDKTSDGAGGSGVEQAKPMPGAEEARAKAVQCIREHGFEDYPDDEEGMFSYEPSDEEAFTEVAKQCDEAAFGALTER